MNVLFLGFLRPGAQNDAQTTLRTRVLLRDYYYYKFLKTMHRSNPDKSLRTSTKFIILKMS